MKNLLKLLGTRGKEPSTWRGLLVLLGLVGVNVSPDQSNAILGLVGAIYAAINVFRPEKK